MTLFSEADWQDCTCISRPLLDDEIGLQYHNRTLTIGRVLAARGNTEVVPQGATSPRGTILRRIGASALTVVLLVGELAHVLDVVLRRARAQRPIGRAHVCTPVTNAQLVCRLLL